MGPWMGPGQANFPRVVTSCRPGRVHQKPARGPLCRVSQRRPSRPFRPPTFSPANRHRASSSRGPRLGAVAATVDRTAIRSSQLFLGRRTNSCFGLPRVQTRPAGGVWQMFPSLIIKRSGAVPEWHQRWAGRGEPQIAIQPLAPVSLLPEFGVPSGQDGPGLPDVVILPRATKPVLAPT